MENYLLEPGIKVLCQKAATFPEGIQDAFKELDRKVPNLRERTVFGLSWRNADGSITYKAATEQIMQDEHQELDLEPAEIPAGTYVTETLVDWMSNIPAIGSIFRQLEAQPGVDKESVFVEWYQGKDAKLMARLKDDNPQV